MTTHRSAIALTTIILLAGALRSAAQSTAFSFSGVLYTTNYSPLGKGPANGNFDFRFSLWPSSAEANPANRIGPTNAFTLQVSAGVFSTGLDFGPLTGGPYFLQSEVRPANSGAFRKLSPRREITPTPLAQHAHTANILLGTISGTNLTGTIADARLSPNVPLLGSSPVFSGTVTATGFIGDGSSLTGLNGAAIQSGTISNTAIAHSTVTAGKIADGQVVKSINGLSDAVTFSAGANVTLTPNGNTVQISANSVAGGLSWQVVSGTAQQASSNTGYLLTNDAQVTLTLPVSPNLGDVVRVSGSGAGGWKIAQNSGQTMLIKNSQSAWLPRENNRSWQAIASSADGSKLVAVVGEAGGQIYTSADSGMTWTAHESSRYWISVASSADGDKLVAAVHSGQIYTSTDSGENWIPRESVRDWYSVASSTDGSKLVAVAFNEQIYTSADSGVTWTPQETARPWYSVASSADGNKLVAGEDSGFIYTSTDSGVTWTPRASAHIWSSIASSADGTKLVAVDEGSNISSPGRIWVSSNSGVTWSARASARRWISVASSTDGTKLIAAAYETGGGSIYISSNSGSSWSPRESYRLWYCVASSADGNKLVAGVSGGQLYLSAGASTLGTTGYLTGEQNSAVELQYTGNGQFILLSHEGTITPY